MKSLIVGNGGRESSIAMRLAENTSLYAVMRHENPTIAYFVKKTGGEFLIGDTNNGKLISTFAKERSIDLAFVSADDPLEAGVVDKLLKEEIRTVGPTRGGAEIEWNKTYALEMMKKILPHHTPRFWIASDPSEVSKIFRDVKAEGLEVVVKPQGLTGGKGVKVMGDHLKDYGEAERYAMDVLKSRIGKSDSVIIVEKLDGIEFTIMAMTDGRTIVFPPATYDHKRLFDGDKGPNTGGMGAFNGTKLPLPFMTEKDFDECKYIIQKAVNAMAAQGRHFNGVLNTGLFLTDNGIKFMEFNARFGDPECMNIMLILNSPFSEALEKMYDRSLTKKNIKFQKKASVVKYLVSPEYAISAGVPRDFWLDQRGIESEGVSVFFSSAVAAANPQQFKTVGNSRCVGLAQSADSIEEAAVRIDDCIEKYVKGQLHYRKDIGSKKELALLERKAKSLRGGK